MGVSGKIGWGYERAYWTGWGCRLQFGSKVKACQEWSSKEDWETQKESSEGRKWRLGLGERQK